MTRETRDGRLANWPLIACNLFARLFTPHRPGIELSSVEIALQRYGQVLSYLVYENTTYWARAGFLLVAHTALLGFTAVVIPELSSEARPERVLLIAVIACVGLLLARLWWTALQRGIDWIERWHRLLLQLEPDAYGDIQFFRGAVGAGTTTRHRVRQVAHRVALLFAVIWFGTLAYAVLTAAILAGMW